MHTSLRTRIDIGVGLLFIALLTFAAVSSLAGQVSFVPPTPQDASTVSTGATVEIASEYQGDLSTFTWQWDGSSYALRNSNLVLGYNFDNIASLGETNTLVKDMSSGGNDGSVIGATHTAQGKIGGAYVFDGSGDGINAGSVDMESVADMTVMAWFKTSNTTTQRVIAKDQVGVKGNFILWFADGQWRFQVYDTTINNWRVAAYASTAPNNGQWHHIAGVVDNAANTIRLYVDGTQVATADFNASTLDDADNEEIVIGADSDIGSHQHVFQGRIDEVRVYTKELSVHAIRERMRTNLTKFDVDSWRMTSSQPNLSTGTYVYEVTAVDTTGFTSGQTQSVIVGASGSGGEVSGDFVLWAAGDPHIQSDLPEYRSYEAALKDAKNGGDEGGEAFHWDISVNAGDYTGKQQCPGDEDGHDLIEQFDAAGVDRNRIYGISGNHDANAQDYSWFRKWVDPKGTQTQFSGVSNSQRPYPVRGAWDAYHFEVGNILFLMLSDRNAGGPPFGRNCNKGYPAGRVTKAQYDWWEDMVEAHPDHIIVTVAHQALVDTTAFTKLNEGVVKHGAHSWADGIGSSMVYAIDNWTVDGLNENQEFIGERPYGFKKYIQENPGAIDFWIHGHTHYLMHPGITQAGNADIQTKDGVTFVNAGALTLNHGRPQAPYSTLFYLDEGSAQVDIRRYMHRTGWGSVPEGFYPPGDISLTLDKEFTYGYRLSGLSSGFTATSTDLLENFATAKKFGERIVLLRKGSTNVARVLTDFRSDMNWSDVTIQTNSSANKSLIDIDRTHHPEVSGDIQLYVPVGTGSGNVFVCPDATDISQVSLDCPNGIQKTQVAQQGGLYLLDVQNGGAIEGVSGGSPPPPPGSPVSFVSPTPIDGAEIVSGSDVSIGVDATTALTSFTWDWATSATSFLNSTLKLLFNMDKVSALGESNALVKDHSGSANSGTVHGATFAGSGRHNGAYSFDGINDYIALGDSLDIGTSDMTLEAWVKTDVVSSASDFIISKSNTSSHDGRWALGVKNGKLRAFLDVGTSVAVDSTITIADDQWHHVAAVFDRSGFLKLYVDGQLDGSASIAAGSGTNYNTGYELRVGAYSNGAAGNVPSHHFQGVIDEIRLYRKALTAADIAQHYQGNLHKLTSTSWKFESTQLQPADGSYAFSATGSSGNTETRTITIGEGGEPPPPPPPPVGTVDLTYPVQHVLFQRDTDASGQILLEGTYTGTPDAIEASFAGSPFVVVDASPTNGTFSGTLGASPGQGTLQVRFKNDAGVTDSQAGVAIGDLFVIGGQSNAEGRATNAQLLSGANQFTATVYRQDDQWRVANDPVDTSSVNGSPFPLVANHIIQTEHVPVAFISTAHGGTTISEWQKGSGRYNGMLNQITEATRGTMKVKTMLFHQGEQDGQHGVAGSYSQYKSLLNQMANDFVADTDIATSVVVAQVGPTTNGPRENRDNIRRAQRDAWNENPHVTRGPVVYDIGPLADGVHFKTNAEIAELAERWWVAIGSGIYGTITDGVGPVASSVDINGNTITVNFTEANTPILSREWDGSSSSVSEGWRIEDGSTVLTDANITNTQLGNNSVTLTLTQSVSQNAKVHLGSWNDGSGKKIIRDRSTHRNVADPIFGMTATSPPPPPPPPPSEDTISFVPPTPEDTAVVAAGSDVSIAVDVIDTITSLFSWTWDGLSVPFYNGNLKLLFNMDKVSALGENGSLVKDHRGGNNGTVHGATFVSSGQHRGAYSFDGANDYIEVGDVLDIGTSDMTLEAWVKTDVVSSASDFIISKSNTGSSDGRWALGVKNGKLRAFLDVGASVAVNSTITIADNQWHHVAAVFDRNGLLTIYVDGQPDGSASIAAGNGANYNTGYKFRVGAYSNGAAGNAPSHHFQGVIDEVRVYHAAYSAAHMQQRYRSNLAKRGSALWEFISTQIAPSVDQHTFKANVTGGQGANETETRTIDVQ